MGNSKMILMITMIICCGIGGISAASYTVGESSGWSMGADYSTWASDKTIKVGDTLVFNYAAGHSVDEVSEDDYKSCTTGNAITSDSSGATSITLKTAGPHYYMCGIPGHCSGGMKLAVTAVAAGAAPTGGSKTSPATPSESGTTTTTSPATTTTASPVPRTTATEQQKEQPSSAAAFSPITAAFLVVSFAVFNIMLV